MTQKTKYLGYIVCAALTTDSCTQSSSQLDSAPAPSYENCDTYIRSALKEYDKNTVIDDAIHMTSKSVAYSATAAGYILDYTVFAGLGIITFAVICPGLVFGVPACLPVEALLSSRQNKLSDNDSTQNRSIQPNQQQAKNPDEIPPGVLGPKIYYSTESLRDDDQIINLSWAYRQTARCYANRGDQDSLAKANWYIKWLSDSLIYQQVSAKERQNINEQSSEIKNTLVTRFPYFEQDMERKNREVVGNLLKKSASSTDWKNPKDGSLWRLIHVNILRSEVALAVCSYLDEDPDSGKKSLWRLPQKRELENALKSGMFSELPQRNTKDKDLRLFAVSSTTPTKIQMFQVSSNELTETLNNNLPTQILCVH
jgi:hypothetical protein